MSANTWEQLRQLRACGLKPGMKLIVTSKQRFSYRLDDIGVMCIVHKPGEVMPVELLEGLEVLFVFESCVQAHAVLRLCRERGVTLEWFRSWCECAKELTTLVTPCLQTRLLEVEFAQMAARAG